MLRCCVSRSVEEVIDESVGVSIEAAQALADVVLSRNSGRRHSFLSARNDARVREKGLRRTAVYGTKKG